MNGAIKVIKRKSVEATIAETAADATTVEAATSPAAGAKIENRSRRELVKTVKNWVVEQRERSRTEQIEGLRQIFGDVSQVLSA